MKLIMAVATFFFTVSAWALDSRHCPAVLAVELSETSIYQKSVNKGVPGWTEARQILLKANVQGVLKFQLVERKREACLYKNNDGATAYLFSAVINDPELPENELPTANLLRVRFPYEKLRLSVLVGVTDYSPNVIELSSLRTDSKSRLRIRLSWVSNPSKIFDYDIGLNPGRCESFISWCLSRNKFHALP